MKKNSMADTINSKTIHRNPPHDINTTEDSPVNTSIFPNFIKQLPPFFRGIIHLTTFYVVCFLLFVKIVFHAIKRRPLYLPVVIYLLSQMVLFGVSGFYHRYNFKDGIIYKQKIYRNIIKYEKHNIGAKLTLQKLDHACIYILIAGTQTSTLLSLYFNKQSIPKNVYRFFLITWFYAFLGILKILLCNHFSLLNLNNDMGNTIIYIIHGFLVLPFIKYFISEMSILGVVCLCLGAFVYSLGGILFALEIPHMENSKFGFHEFWHLQTVIANSIFGLPIFLKYREWWNMPISKK